MFDWCGYVVQPSKVSIPFRSGSILEELWNSLKIGGLSGARRPKKATIGELHEKGLNSRNQTFSLPDVAAEVCELTVDAAEAVRGWRRKPLFHDHSPNVSCCLNDLGAQGGIHIHRQNFVIRNSKDERPVRRNPKVALREQSVSPNLEAEVPSNSAASQLEVDDRELGTVAYNKIGSALDSKNFVPHPDFEFAICRFQSERTERSTGDEFADFKLSSMAHLHLGSGNASSAIKAVVKDNPRTVSPLLNIADVDYEFVKRYIRHGIDLPSNSPQRGLFSERQWVLRWVFLLLRPVCQRHDGIGRESMSRASNLQRGG